MTEEERCHYNTMAKEAQEEYSKLHQEYRATGNYDASNTRFHQLEGVGPWVHTLWHEKNGLEQEIATYDTVVFPVRPPAFEEDYNRRLEERTKLRRDKERAEAALYTGTRKRRRKRKKAESDANPPKLESLEETGLEIDKRMQETLFAMAAINDDLAKTNEEIDDHELTNVTGEIVEV